MKDINEIQEIRNIILNSHVLDILDLKDFRDVIHTKEIFDKYINLIFKENDVNYKDLIILAENMRIAISENIVYFSTLNNSFVLSFFILDEVYKNTIIKEVGNIVAIDKPDVIKAFIQVVMKEKVKLDTSDDNDFIQPSVSFNMLKKRFCVVDKKISDDYIVDNSVLDDINLIEEEITKISKLITDSLDKNFLDELIEFCEKYNSEKLIVDVEGRCPHNDIMINLLSLSAEVYCETHIGSSNTIVINSKNINLFDGLDFQIDSKTTTKSLKAGRWKVVTTDLLDESKILCLYHSDDFARSCFPVGFYQLFRFLLPAGIILRNTQYSGIRRNFCGIINLVDDSPRPIREPRNERKLDLKWRIENNYDVPPDLLETYVKECNR